MTASSGETPAEQGRGLMRFVTRLALPLVVLATGGALAIALIETAPKAARKPPERQARLVEVQPVRFARQCTLVHAMGTVQAAREVVLRPRVAGEIVAVSKEFLPGGSFLEGQILLEIDPTDYALAVQQAESDVAEAQSDLALEVGQQSVAQREYELLGETIREEDRALVLRQPQLEKVRARLKTAQAALEQARLNLQRTKVKAPFNSLVRSREVNVGVQVTTSTSLATLVGTDQYWIEVTLPVDQLRWLDIPHASGGTGSTVRIFNEAAWGLDRQRTGRVIRLLGDLEEEGRMARLLVAVPDPLAYGSDHANQPRLLLDDYVRVEIEGIEIDSVATVERRFVREGDRVWVMNGDNQLEIRPVAIAYRGRDVIFVSNGVRDGERIVTTDLASPVAGMPLRTLDGSPSPQGPAEKAS